MHIYKFSNSFLYTMKMLSIHHTHHDLPKCTSCHKAIVGGHMVFVFPDRTSGIPRPTGLNVGECLVGTGISHPK